MNLLFRKSISIAVLLSLSLLSIGCSNKIQTNPYPDDIRGESIKENAERNFYEKKGYIEGKRDGFREGVEWSKKSIDKLMEEFKAIQFSNYLIKEKYIQPGPVYIDKDGRIILSKMEIQAPFTKADIFNKFGGQIPTYMDDDAMDIFKQTSGETKKAPVVLNKTFNPTVLNDSVETKEVNKKSVGLTFVQLQNTKTNQDLAVRFGLVGSLIDDKFVVKFNNKQEAVDFCANFDICLNLSK